MPSIGIVDKAFKQPANIITITSTTPQETLLETPEDLPTTEQTSQVVYTLQESDFPVITPSSIYTYQPVGCLVGAGYNSSGSTATIYYRAIKNGTSVLTGNKSSMPNNQYYTFQFFGFYNSLAVGDTIELRLWSSATGVNFDYKALTIYPTRIGFSNTTGWLLSDLNIDASKTTLSLGTAQEASNYSMRFLMFDTIDYISASNKKYNGIRYLNTYKFGKVSAGDDGGGCLFYYNHATYRPYYSTNWFQTKISYRNLNLNLG
jgi:hypothetical protein